MKKTILAIVISFVSVVSVLPNTPYTLKDYDYKMGAFEAQLFMDREMTPEVKTLHDELVVMNKYFPNGGFQGLKGFYDSLN